jgi:hypothetical protein
MIDPCVILGRLNSIDKQLTVYKITLSGYSFFIPANNHNIPIVKGYLVLDPTGEEVEIEFKLFSDQSIQLTSNVLLDGHILILY